MTAPSQDYRTILLTQNQVAIVDVADFDWLNQWKWHAWWNQFTQSYYAVRNIYLPDRSRTKVQMHRVILGLAHKSPERGDHKESGMTLDNRRSNLRIASGSQNVANSRPRRSKKWGSLKGTSWNADKKRWIASIRVQGVTYRGPHRWTEAEAHADYRILAVTHFGEFARFK